MAYHGTSIKQNYYRDTDIYMYQYIEDINSGYDIHVSPIPTDILLVIHSCYIVIQV